MTISMGDGYFLDDTDEDEEDAKDANDGPKDDIDERDSELDQMFGHIDSRNQKRGHV